MCCATGSKNFSLNPVKRRGNRRYYQRQDVLMIRQIRALLYDQGFTIEVRACGFPVMKPKMTPRNTSS